ncbi:MAG: stage V sporulation protein AA [Defluviitaleaceae bacterium]|nr:stage V sporulation protein AA [Defluviitaleaceae bacterium]
MDIYLKLKKKASLSGTSQVTIRDVAEIIAMADVAQKLDATRVLAVDAGRKRSYLVSVTDVVKLVKKAYPDATVTSLGETDTWVDYSPVHVPEPAWLRYCKISLIAVVLFVGSATAIMSFHNDAEIPKVFARVFEMIVGHKTDSPRLIEIPYSIGLAVGIIVFFNHAFGHKATDDPTPIEVQMSKYDTEVSDMMISIMERQAEEREGTGNGGS